MREVDLGAGRVRTVAGGELFAFGDADGAGDAVRLQHPIGIAAGGGRLLVADSFNHAVKEVEPRSGRVVTLLGGGGAGPLRATLAADGGLPPVPARAGPGIPLLFEPEGLALHGARVLVADTNNHRVVGVDLATGDAWIVAGGPE